jgi:hypothetical protein
MKHSQLELFLSSNDSVNTNKELSNPLFKYIRDYEKIILITIGFVVTGVISFSLGVEKGRQATNAAASLEVIQKQDFTETPKPKEPAQKYAIQLASYKTKSLAQKEAEILKKKGYSPSVLSKSGYAVLYVGDFSNKETAQSSLSELRKRYRDCLIRRL